MSHPFIHLRRVLFGTSCAIVFGFGATQALASPTQVASSLLCTASETAICNDYCAATFGEGRCRKFDGRVQCSCVYN
ncbi:MAG TPA: hypothetical protein VF615_19980 [Longimicrobiaceae bacterium]|jgi:hypothetical protein